MHYYQFNIADYRKDTTHLNPLEHYIYRQLIDWYFLDEKPINKNLNIVLRRLNLDQLDHTHLLENVLLDFFVENDDGFHHKRIDIEIKGYQSYLNKQSENGKKGGRPHKIKTQKNPPLNLDNPNLTQKKPNQEPLTTNQELLTKDQKTIPQIKFDDFWDLWPKKVDKKDSVKAWKSLSDEKRRNAIEGIENFITGKQIQYIKNPTSYLKKELWTDEEIPNATHQQGYKTNYQQLEENLTESEIYLQQLLERQQH